MHTHDNAPTPKTRTIEVAYPSGHVLVVDAGTLARLSPEGFQRLQDRIRALTSHSEVVKKQTRAGDLLLAPIQSPTADCEAHVVRQDGVPTKLILDLDPETPEPGLGAGVPAIVPPEPTVLVGHATPRSKEERPLPRPTIAAGHATPQQAAALQEAPGVLVGHATPRAAAAAARL